LTTAADEGSRRRRLMSWWPWHRRPLAAQDSRRWVVADVESSGLNPRADRLLAIAAVAVHFNDDFSRPCIELADAFEVFIRQPEAHTRSPDKDNILIHGIGVGAQRGGQDPRQALLSWERYLADSPLVGFHSAFDQVMIDRATHALLGRRLRNEWLDLEPLASVVHEDPRSRNLDHWLARHRITCFMRHQASADALATAQLLLALWPKVRQKVDGRFAAVLDLAASQRFLPGRSR
jgi:DNA polymerase-3 subunit epsilon